MEFVNRLRNVSLELEKVYIKDMIKMIDVIYSKYDIMDRSTKRVISKYELISEVGLSIKDTICIAMCQTGSKCIRKAINGGEYCRMHIGLSIKNNINNSNIIEIKNEEINDEMEDEMGDEMEGNVILKLIGDVFYYVGEKYIYDRETGDKVGYVKMNEYILTDDPFILDGWAGRV